MRENRLYGSEGGAAKAVPTPIGIARHSTSGVSVSRANAVA
jgi:hypothetical protein